MVEISFEIDYLIYAYISLLKISPPKKVLEKEYKISNKNIFE
jgi:hypothetical protein